MNFPESTRKREQAEILALLEKHGWEQVKPDGAEQQEPKLQGFRRPDDDRVLLILAPDTEGTPFARNNGPLDIWMSNEPVERTIRDCRPDQLEALLTADA